MRHVGHGLTTNGAPYLAMEWLVGETLGQRLQRGALAIDEVITLGERLADALDHAHKANVIHRDLKPSNIFLVDYRFELAKVIDFGVAKAANYNLTQAGQIIGTPGYMAPEQVRGAGSVDRRVDLFALGCVLYGSPAGRGESEPPGQARVPAHALIVRAPRHSRSTPDGSTITSC